MISISTKYCIEDISTEILIHNGEVFHLQAIFLLAWLMIIKSAALKYLNISCSNSCNKGY